jgi:hypothetical protein
MDLQELHKKFSIITVGENKRSNFAWAEQQTKPLSWDKFVEHYNYKGGITKQNGEPLPPTTGIALVTGYADVEVLDVDMKVFSTAQEKTNFWNEFTTYLSDNIFDFEEKFVIYKTKNEGYHILYRTKRVEGNQKLAKLKGHKEAVIETRGLGGYVVCYFENKLSKKSYLEIDYISDDDREILFSFARMYDFIPEVEYKKPEKQRTNYDKSGLTPWDDYNQKTDIFSLINDTFEVKHRLESAKKFVIKRFGAESVHSGYIFKDSMCMYLFSTGTIYPAEKLLSPFHVYAYKYHNGNFSDASSELYKKGYGDRLKIEIPEKIKENIKIENDVFPLDVFPKDLQIYLSESERNLMLNIEIMASSVLWLTSVIIGNSHKIRIKNGWYESPIVFLALVGQSGLGKTPSLNQVINPLKKINQKKVEDYLQEYEKYSEHLELAKKSKKNVLPIAKPRRKQILASDTTLEALISLHNESKNAIGINKDELDGWFKDMNKYREGSDKQQWLSIWSNESINVNRLSRGDLYIASPFISVIGGIQPEILDAQFTQENVSSGFIDRFLFCYPKNLKAQPFNSNDLDPLIIEHYNNTIHTMYRSVIERLKYRETNDIKPTILNLEDAAYLKFNEYFDYYTNKQNSDDEPEMFKSMLAKIKTYLGRITLIIHFLEAFYNNQDVQKKITKESVEKAFKLTEYFISQFKRIKIDSMNTKEIIDIKRGKNENTATTFEAIYKQVDKDKINKSQLAKQFSVSRQTINRWIEKLEKNGDKK